MHLAGPALGGRDAQVVIAPHLPPPSVTQRTWRSARRRVRRAAGSRPVPRFPHYNSGSLPAEGGLDLPAPERAGETPADVETGLDDRQRRVVRLCLIGLAVLGTGSMIGAL